MKVSLYSKVYSGKDVLSVSHCSSHKIHCSVRTKVRLQQWLRTAMKLGPGHFCPVYDSSTSNVCTRALRWKLRHPLSGAAASGFPAQFSLQPLLKWVTNLHGGLKAFWASLGSHSPFTGIALSKYLVILTPSWSLLPGCLPHAPWIDTLLPTTTDLLFVNGDEICVFCDYSIYSFVHGFFHSAWQSGDLSILLKLSGVNCIFIAK